MKSLIKSSVFLNFLFFGSAVNAMSKVACNDSGKIYKVCEDQKNIFQRNAKLAIDTQRLMLITFGADWCAWCKSMDKVLTDPQVWDDIASTFVRLEIGVYASDGRKSIASGQKVFQDLLESNRKKEQDFKGIPLIAVVDPKTNKAVFIKTAELEDATEGQNHDKAKVKQVLKDAAKSLTVLPASNPTSS